MVGFNPQCCCTPPPPPYCCDLKTVDRWEIEAIDHTPVNCCTRFEGTYYPDTTGGSGVIGPCSFRRKIVFADYLWPPCVSDCKTYLFPFGVEETYHLTVASIDITTVLESEGYGARTSIEIEWFVDRSTPYGPCFIGSYVRTVQGSTNECNTFEFPFWANVVEWEARRLIPTCDDSLEEKFFRLTTVLV